MEKAAVERLVEEVLKAVTGTDASVCSMLDEWSINVGGKLFRFVIDDEMVTLETVPLRD